MSLKQTRKKQIIKLSYVHRIFNAGCSPPPDVPYSSYYPISSRYEHGSSVTYTCDPGYAINLDKRTCRNGYWTDAPKCRRKWQSEPCTCKLQCILSLSASSLLCGFQKFLGTLRGRDYVKNSLV